MNLFLFVLHRKYPKSWSPNKKFRSQALLLSVFLYQFFFLLIIRIPSPSPSRRSPPSLVVCPCAHTPPPKPNPFYFKNLFDRTQAPPNSPEVEMLFNPLDPHTLNPPSSWKLRCSLLCLIYFNWEANKIFLGVFGLWDDIWYGSSKFLQSTTKAFLINKIIKWLFVLFGNKYK